MKREILIGITGGIAAYKTAYLVSRLIREDFGVAVIMTESAMQLIGPKTFEALSGRPVRHSLFESDRIHTHIELAREAEIFCIAPASANIIAKAANGIADDLLSTTILSFQGPLLLAPAMNTLMWEKPAVQRNIATLKSDGVKIIGPESGRLSCGETGSGRMSEPDTIFDEIVAFFNDNKF